MRGTLTCDGNGFIDIPSGAGSLTLGQDGDTLFDVQGSSYLTVNAVIADNVPNDSLTTSACNLIKTGTGRLELNADNTYTGTTTLSAGTTIIGSSRALANTAVTLNGGKITLSNALTTAAVLSKVSIGATSKIDLTNAQLIPNCTFDPSFTADWALAQSLVPEPTSAAACVLVGGLAITRRRRG